MQLRFGGLDTENKGFVTWEMLKFADKWASLAAAWSYDMASVSAYRKQCVLGWMLSTSDMETMCLENNKGTQTQRSEELQEAFIAGLLQILHTSQELVRGSSAKKIINFISMASVSRLSLGALQKP